ncbi:DUF2169 family type VI secretion system accessory protein [Pseudoduganella buxea]|nr:DUF2169 domain-containing protein [Pseudoduganella buxea]GGC23013.1 hypothetical protein GCM10011572_50660 [Pseudoduganella buxea]
MTPLPTIPALRFDNRTVFDALHFDTIDQHDIGFHVIVAKIGYRLGLCDERGQAQLQPLDTPAALYTEDRFHEDRVECSVRVESDLAPYKPRCDVIVLGDAHAPGGRPAKSFDVTVRVQMPDQPALLPEPPRPLNPFQPISGTVRRQWQSKLAGAADTRTPGRLLINKSVRVTGPRELRRAGVLRPGWQLTSPSPVVKIPLRYEYAQGGECMVDGGSVAASRVPEQWRLTPEQQSNYGHMPVAPAAHGACEYNPTGRGFAPEWYLKATRTTRLPAPQLEYLDVPFSARMFARCSQGKSELVPAGLGFVGRAWLPRRKLVGTIDPSAAWYGDDVPRLPGDFDFAYWNGAPHDQQCDHPAGGEQVTLVNLSAPDAPFARDGVVRFRLPHERLFALGVNATDAVAATPLSIDTIIIDTASARVEVTWRLCLIADGEFAEVRLLHASTPEQLQRLQHWNSPEQTQDSSFVA